MAHRIKPTHHDKSGPAFYWTTLALAGLGFVDATYLLILKMTQSEFMCIGSHGCITVNNSVYSEIYGIPVSMYGILAYLAILAVLLLETKWKRAKETGPYIVFGGSLVGVFFSAYLTYIEADILHTFCPFCMASAVIITLILILAIIRLIKQSVY
jgi:uncharacterized membrane protein